MMKGDHEVLFRLRASRRHIKQTGLFHPTHAYRLQPRKRCLGLLPRLLTIKERVRQSTGSLYLKNTSQAKALVINMMMAPSARRLLTATQLIRSGELLRRANQESGLGKRVTHAERRRFDAMDNRSVLNARRLDANAGSSRIQGRRELARNKHLTKTRCQVGVRKATFGMKGLAQALRLRL
jgi:hypothetical protein